MKVELVNVKDSDKLIEEIKKSWPIVIPEPSFVVTKRVECYQGERVLIVSEDEPKIEGECLYLWSKPDPRTVAIRALELAYAKTEKAITRRSFISGREYEVLSKVPKVSDACLARLGCNQCVSSCPNSAIRIENGKAVIDPAKCTNCGLCSSSCPVGAIESPLLDWNGVAGLYRTLSGGKLKISCDPKVGDVVVPCIGYMGVEEITLLKSKFDIELVCPNEKCVNRKAAERALEIAKELNPKERAQVEVVGLKRNDYVKAVTLTKLEGEAKVDVHAFRIEVNDNCTICGVCARKCPTGALGYVFSEKTVKLTVEPGRCVGCNHCVNVCKEGAIRVVKTGSYAYLREDYSYTVAEDEIAFCRSCGRPIDSKRVILKVARILNKDPEELMYCNECKQKMVAERILKSWTSRFGEVRKGR